MELIKEEGSVLLLTLIVITILMMLVIGLMRVTTNEIKISSYNEQRIKSFYLAEAGVERALDIINDKIEAGDFDPEKLSFPDELKLENRRGSFNLSESYYDQDKEVYIIKSKGKIDNVSKIVKMEVSLSGSIVTSDTLEEIIANKSTLDNDIILGGSYELNSNNNQVGLVNNKVENIPIFDFNKYKSEADKIYSDIKSFEQDYTMTKNNLNFFGEIIYIELPNEKLVLDLLQTTITSDGRPVFFVIDGDLEINKFNKQTSISNVYFIINGKLTINNTNNSNRRQGNSTSSNNKTNSNSSNHSRMNNCFIYAIDDIELNANGIEYIGAIITLGDLTINKNNNIINPALDYSYGRLYTLNDSISIIYWEEE